MALRQLEPNLRATQTELSSAKAEINQLRMGLKASVEERNQLRKAAAVGKETAATACGVAGWADVSSVAGGASGKATLQVGPSPRTPGGTGEGLVHVVIYE
jgi:hypothetical protein